MGTAARFLKYQRGSFLLSSLPMDLEPANLRRCLIGGLRYGSTMCINIDAEGQDVDLLFSDLFPEAVLSRGELYREETWKPLVREEEDGVKAEELLPRDEFKFVCVTEFDPPPPIAASKMTVVRVTAPSRGGAGGSGSSSVGDELAAVAAAYGVKEIKRNSRDMVEDAFEGNVEAVQGWIEKGYDIESVDGHKHTALSEASVKGHNEVVKLLLEKGADPNRPNDKGRTPLYRAAFNGLLDTVELLLKSGADPDAKDDSLEGPFDITHSEEVRKMLTEWPREETARLREQREKEIRAAAEERLRTAADREAAAKAALRDELVEFAKEGNQEGIEATLDRAIMESMSEGGRPRASANVRDERGNTLLMLAAWHGHRELVNTLLTKWKELDPVMEETDIKVWKTNIHSRDAKGWTAVMIAAFHDHAAIVRMLLDAGADPHQTNVYHKNTFDLAAEHPEVLSVLQDWESSRMPARPPPASKEEAAGAGSGEAAAEGKGKPAKAAGKKKAKGKGTKKGGKAAPKSTGGAGGRARPKAKAKAKGRTKTKKK